MGWAKTHIVFLSALTVLQARSVAVPAEVFKRDALLDAGYCIQIVQDGPIKLSQDPRSQDPYHTYSGCSTLTVLSNFPARLTLDVESTGAVGGKWQAKIQPPLVKRGKSRVEVCVQGSNVLIELHPAGQQIKVAEISVVVLPL